jgi:hypothetical protein
MRAVRLLLLVACAAALSGCAGLGRVEAWEKGNLARPSMRFDTDPLDARFSQHVYTSKEAASGGGAVGGGGCGCN